METEEPGGRGNGETPVARFAHELRRLRAEAGSPSFRQLARTTHYSASTLAEATAGRKLPTEPVVKAFAIACGSDPAVWASRLAEAARQMASTVATDAEPGNVIGLDAISPPQRRLRRPSRRALGWLALGLVLGVAAGALIGRDVAPKRGLTASPPAVQSSAVTTAIPTAEPSQDGADPHALGCSSDARPIDKSPVMMAGLQVGSLELMYSPHCAAGWARVYLYPGQPTMLGFVQVRSSDGRLSSYANLMVKQVPVYTDVIVPGDGCLGATATVYAVGKPPSYALITCQAMNTR